MTAMIPAGALPRAPGLQTLAMRSLATNGPFMACGVAAVSVIYGLFSWNGQRAKRGTFLRSLAKSNINDAEFLRFYRSNEPLALAEDLLKANCIDLDLAQGLRTALAATL